ncbi:hypothetical protein EDD21DRAFT_392734 [Dissophora ornata]|nr:hypothetical protein EDD21DRAFT_392734 [Dissophora ornata]
MSNYSTSPPAPGPLNDNMRRAGSNGRGIKREDSMRRSRSSSTNGGGYRNMIQNASASPLGYSNSASSGSVTGRSDDGGYLDDPAYAGLRDKLRVKCHYIDTRAVLVRADTPLQELLQRVQEKFQTQRPLKLKYKDEDAHMLSMIDDEDWLMAQQVHMETTGSLDRMELWCFDEE